ncbi:Cof-type HAD-IIB family hydrolase [Bacillaceae bacterium S4-13-56]
MDIRLIALDMDGTLVNDEHEVSQENRQAIKRAEDNGIHVILSTGRSLMNARDTAESIGISSYIITLNGGEIYNSKLELIERTPLSAEHVLRFWEMKEEHNIFFWSSTVQGMFNSKRLFDQPIDSYEWLKFGFDIPDDAVRQVILDELVENKELEVTNSSPTNIEINAAGVNKAAALKKVTNWLEITMDHVMAVGDSINDLAMIREAGFGVAMGNAQEIVKKEADWVTETNNDHGVARAIEKVLKG